MTLAAAAQVLLEEAQCAGPNGKPPTVGIVLCRGRSDSLVRYALAGSPTPLAVADYTYATLPPQGVAGCRPRPEVKAALADTLPSPAEPAALSGDACE